MNSIDTNHPSQKPERAEPKAGACCPTTELASCCEPSAKGSCCGPQAGDTARAPSSCGCR